MKRILSKFYFYFYFSVTDITRNAYNNPDAINTLTYNSNDIKNTSNTNLQYKWDDFFTFHNDNKSEDNNHSFGNNKSRSVIEINSDDNKSRSVIEINSDEDLISIISSKESKVSEKTKLIKETNFLNKKRKCHFSDCSRSSFHNFEIQSVNLNKFFDSPDDYPTLGWQCDNLNCKRTNLLIRKKCFNCDEKIPEIPKLWNLPNNLSNPSVYTLNKRKSYCNKENNFNYTKEYSGKNKNNKIISKDEIKISKYSHAKIEKAIQFLDYIKDIGEF